MTQIINGKYIIELDELTSIELVDWLAFQPNTVSDQAYRISLENFISALPIIPAVAGEYDNIAAMLAAQGGQTVDVFYKVADPSDDPDYNDLKDSEIKSVYYHLVDAKTGSLSNYNSIAIPKLESSKFPKLGNSLEALTFDVKFRSAEWSSNEATLQAIANALKVSSPQDLLLDALSLKLNTDNNPTDISRVLFGLDGQMIFEPIDSSKIQSDSDAGDVTLNDSYQLLLTITGNQNIANGLANIGVTAKSFSTAAIASFNPSGNNRVRANSAAHGLSEGDYVEIVNEPLYNGIYEIKAVPNINDFDFTHSYDGAGSGDWEKSENREIAVDLRVDAISQKVFTRQIEGEGRLNFSEQLSGLVNGEDIDVYVKSNTVGEAIEILGTTQSSQLKVVNSDNGVINITYDDLETLRAASGLIEGQQYKITDYKTKHEIPNTTTIHTGSTEPIIITANKVNSFYEQVISTIYPQDEIWYDFTDNLCEDSSTPRTGKIIYRHDLAKDIKCFYDWRAVTFRRWQCSGLDHAVASLNVNTFEATVVYGTVDATPDRYREYYIDFGTAAHTANPQLQLTKTNVVTRELVQPDGTPFTSVNELQTYLGTNNFGLVYYSPLLDKYVLVDNETENDMVKDKYILFSDADVTIGNGTRLVVNSGVYNDALTFVNADPGTRGISIGNVFSAFPYNNIRFDSLTNVRDIKIGTNCREMSFPVGRCLDCVIGDDSYNNIFYGETLYATFGQKYNNNLMIASNQNNYCHIHSIGGDSLFTDNTLFTRGDQWFTTVRACRTSTFRFWGASPGDIEGNYFDNVEDCFINIGLSSAGTFKFNKFASIKDKAFEGPALNWSNVNYSQASQSVESYDFDLTNTLFIPGQAAVQGKTISFTATPTFNFSTGTNNQQMPVEGNVTTFATSNELNAGNYDVWLVNDATPGRTVVAPTGWPDEIPGGDTHDTAANAVNLYQFKVSPSGLKRYIIKNM